MAKKLCNDVVLTPISNKYDVFGKFCRIYNDGSHFVARHQLSSHSKKRLVLTELIEEKQYLGGKQP